MLYLYINEDIRKEGKIDTLPELMSDISVYQCLNSIMLLMITNYKKKLASTNADSVINVIVFWF